MKRSRGLYMVSPPVLMAVAWIFTIVGVEFAYAARDVLPVTVRTMQLNDIDFGFPTIGMVWIGLSLLTFLIIGFAATKPIPRSTPSIRSRDLSLAVRVGALVHVFIVIVVTLWVAVGAQSVGGLNRLIELAAEQETVYARDTLLANKLFPGMRLLYTGLNSLGVFGACIFAANLYSEDPNRRDMRIGLAMFLASTVVLSLLPIILSQRILLIHMVLSTFVAVSLVSGRLFHLRYVLVLGALLMTVWSVREAVTVGDWASEYSTARIGVEKLLYYLVNDFFNAVIPFAIDIPHTLGLLSFGFIFEYTPFDQRVFGAAIGRLDVVNSVRAGGAYPALTAPYVDFSWFGIVLIAALALLFAWIFNKAQRSFAYAVIYGQIGGALLLSPHSAWYSHPNFTFNILLTCIVCSFIRKRRHMSAGDSYETA